MEIDLSFNYITTLNLFLKSHVSLIKLNISCNSLTSLNGIENLLSLEELNASHNKISSLEAVNKVSHYFLYKIFFILTS